MLLKSFVARATLGAAALASALVPTGACTLAIEPSITQCSSDADCSIAARGSAFEGFVCDTGTSLCVKSATYCNSNAQCIDANGGAENVFCNKKTNGCQSLTYKNYCVDLLAEKGDLRNDDAILVGLHWASGLDEELRLGEVALDLARKDFNSTVQGIPRASGPSRPVVIVACNFPPSAAGKGDASVGREMTDFLLETVGVKVMVGPIGVTGEDVVYALDKANKNDAYLFTVQPLYNTAASVPGQATHSLFVNLDTATVYRGYARMIERFLAALPEPDPARPFRVAMVTPTDATEADEVPGFASSLIMNGRPAAAQQADASGENGDFLYVQYGADANNTSDPNFVNALARLTKFAPDVIGCRGVTCLDVLDALERAQPGVAHWVLGGQQIQNFDFTRYIDDDAGRKRFTAIGASRPDEDPRWTNFANFYLAPKLNEDLQITKLGGLTYDIGYFLHLGLTAVGDEPLTGTAFHQALSTRFKVPGAAPDILVDPTKIQQVTRNTLLGGQVLNAGGVQLDFEISPLGTLANPPADFGCVTPGTAAKPNRMVSSGLTYSVREDRIVGTTSCL